MMGEQHRLNGPALCCEYRVNRCSLGDVDDGRHIGVSIANHKGIIVGKTGDSDDVDANMGLLQCTST